MTTVTKPQPNGIVSLAEVLWPLDDGQVFELPGPVTIVEHQRSGRDETDWFHDDTEDVSLVLKVGEEFHRVLGQIDSYGDMKFVSESTVTPVEKTVTIYE